MLLHELFSAAADAHPDALAVVSTRGALTFRALQKRARQIAYALRSRGITRHTPAALLLPRSIESVAAIFGILYAGAAPGTDGYQLAHLLEHTALASARRLGFRRAVTICTHRATVLQAAQAGFRRICARDYATFALGNERPLQNIPNPHSEAVLFELELEAYPG